MPTSTATPELIKLPGPVPVWHVVCGRNASNDPRGVDLHDIILTLVLNGEADRKLLSASFRGTSIDRLPHVLEHGVDVEPTDSVMFVGEAYKALEYGGWPKVVMALDSTKLEPTWKEVSSSVPEDEKAALRAMFPTSLMSKDGTKLWFSRMPADDSRVGSAYERSYARYLPPAAGNPLIAVFLFAESLSQS